MTSTLTQPNTVTRPSREQETAFEALALRYASVEVRHAPTTMHPDRFEARCFNRAGQVAAIRRLDGDGRDA